MYGRALVGKARQLRPLVRTRIIGNSVRGMFGKGEQVDMRRRAQLASYAILDMGMGVAAWYREGGPHSPEEIAFAHADFAISMLRRS